MFPLTAITWRLGELSSEDFENIIPLEPDKLLNDLHKITGGVYFMVTCQRIILAIDNTESWMVTETISGYARHLEMDENEFIEPEIYQGLDALINLSKVISGLDSVVLGEYEIQRQFKEGYDNSLPYMGPNLKTYMQYIIRVGKRVRTEINLNRNSTIEAIERVIPDEMQAAESIGLIGTGKMGKLILDYYSSLKDKITVYSTHDERSGDQLANMDINCVENLQYHDILFTATSTAKFVNSDFLAKFGYDEPTVLVDLGMPRNCVSEDELPNHIELLNIEKLVELSRRSSQNKEITRALELIEKEVNQIINEYRHQMKSKFIVGLRTEMSKLAENRKSEIMSEEASEKDFTQFVNSMMHVSQKYLEKIMFQEELE